MFVCWIETGVMVVINSIILAIGILIAGLAAIMPTIPDAPEFPDAMTTALGWIAWFFPVGTLVDIMGFMIAAWILWFALSIGLRWARAL
jgi:hypothetical protein